MSATNGSSSLSTARPWVLGVRGGEVSRQVSLSEGTVVLGAGRGCGVVLRGREVAREHARLQLTADRPRLSVFPHATPAVFNGIQVREAGLAPGDSITVGGVELTLHRDASRGGDGARSAADGEPPAVVAKASPEGNALRLLETLCLWGLRGPASSRGEMLAALCVELDATVGCLFLAEVGASPVCLAAWGDAAAVLAEVVAALPAAREVDGLGEAAGDGWAAAAVTLPSRGRCGLMLAGRKLRRESPEVLRVAARLFTHDYLRGRASAAPIEPRLPVAGLVFPPEIVIGRSPAMRHLYEEVATLVDSDLPVLVLGDTGVGKEHIARVLHDSSRRRDRPYVTINCAAIPAELLEAELFGIERGVATGVSERLGKFREAHGGTIFLDEIGELPPPLQAKLLRALEEKSVRPVGGQAAPVDLRVVAATNVPLVELTDNRRLRLDLFHRLAGFVVEVPPLRARPEDVPLLFEYFLRTVGGTETRLTPGALAALVRHRWDGNVRELRHEAARVAARARGAMQIDLGELSPNVAAMAGTVTAASAPHSTDVTLDAELARVETVLLATALREARGNVSHAAKRLGISRARLRRRAAELGVAIAQRS